MPNRAPGPRYRSDADQITPHVYLNDRVYLRNVPTKLWDFTISRYVAIMKWLSYREWALLDQSLNVDEPRYVTETARRLAFVMIWGAQLDDSYGSGVKRAHKW